MAKYIPLDALVAEIERRFDEYSSSILKHYDACKEAKAQELGKILTIIDTLEVKEVDLDMEINLYVRNLHRVPNFEELNKFARHFFELGLKARKGKEL